MAGILESVKNALGITGTYQDDTLNVYIEEVKGYMVDSGVPEEIASSDMSAGVIARGVTDLWNYSGSAGKPSEYFYQRITQLVYAIKTGKIIALKRGDFGISFPVNIVGVDIATDDTLTFSCGDFTKTFSGVSQNCLIISFTESESNGFEIGTYGWSLKLSKDNAYITVVNDGTLIVY